MVASNETRHNGIGVSERQDCVDGRTFIRLSMLNYFLSHETYHGEGHVKKPLTHFPTTCTRMGEKMVLCRIVHIACILILTTK
jgi:hypothetical protein